MARGPLVVAGSTGVWLELCSGLLGGALFGLAREVAFGEPSGLGPTCPLPPFEPEGWTLDLPSVILGLCLGLLPLLDLAFLFRVQLLRQARRRLGAVNGWYRLVDE